MLLNGVVKRIPILELKMLKIVTWNLNGIRSSQQDLKTLFDSLECDIICLQETKITRDMLDEATAFVDGYNSFYSFSRKRSGYSGVATYCRENVIPFKAEEGITGKLNSVNNKIEFYDHIQGGFTDNELKDLDSEGRCVMTLHQFKESSTLVIFNVYCPNGGETQERQDFKLKFYTALELRCRDMIEQGYHVIVLGDLNVSHRLIDHCEPEDVANFSKTPPRQWLDGFLSNGKFIDAFRHLYPMKEKSFTCWNTKINARVNNYGTRIDYILLSSGLVSTLSECEIMADFQGSDHCPVRAHLALELEPSDKIPGLCTKYFKEFAGKQLKMSSFVVKRSLADPSGEPPESKKPKIAVSKGKQQSSLLKFFGQPKATIESSSSETCFVDTESSLISSTVTSSSSSSAALWKNVFKGPPPAPLCAGHGEPSVLRTVKKKGANYNRQFWACARAAGHSTDPKAQCNFFAWAKR